MTESVERYLRQLFPSRLSIPATRSTIDPKMQALYDTRNRGERIRYAQLKRTEGYTINDIALLLHSSESTISKYLSIPEEEVPQLKENARELQHIGQMNRKQQAINEVRKFHAQGHSMDEIMRLTGHTWLTINNYLKENCSINNGHYDLRRPCKLAPYEQDVISMRAQGITYSKIHKKICSLGYQGTVASLRVFMQKERTHQKALYQKNSIHIEYIPRKYICQLIYRELEYIKGLTEDESFLRYIFLLDIQILFLYH